MDCRNQFTFYKSFDDVAEAMDDKQLVEYMRTLLDVQFLRIKIDDVFFNDPILNLVWKSQKHSIEKSIHGYLESQKSGKVKTPYLGIYDTSQIPSEGLRQQEEDKEQGEDKGKEEDKEQGEEQKNTLSSFESFWEAYPRKEGKGKARMSFYKATGKTTVDIILTAIRIQEESDSWKKENGKFIPQPEKWLDGEHWLDEVAITATLTDKMNAVRQMSEEGII